jgi:hypothetical protein
VTKFIPFDLSQPEFENTAYTRTDLSEAAQAAAREEGRQAGIREAMKAAAGEYLDDPQDDSDHAYQRALNDAIAAIEALLTTPPPAVSVKVKPLDLSNLLKHAFIAGRTSAGGSASFDAEHWVEYDPAENAAYHRILSQIETAPMAVEEAARLLLEECKNRAESVQAYEDDLFLSHADFDLFTSFLRARTSPKD